MQYKTTTTGLYIPLATPELAELTPADLGRYRAHLIAKGKATSTVEKYMHDAESSPVCKSGFLFKCIY